MKKHSVMIQILLTEKIDCIHFAKLSLYSVNTVQVCKICRLRLYCKKNRVMLEYLYWISFYRTRGGW